MNPEILSKEVQQFINDNLTADLHKILFKKSPFPKVTTKELVVQIESKAKAKKKLPTWFATQNIYYPNKLNLSQSSSEITAQYKASLLNGATLADLTAGLGVDSFAFSKHLNRVTHVERNGKLSAIANYNFEQLGITNVQFENKDALSFLNNTGESFDWLYIDPSRRDKDNKKVFFLSDCEPDVVHHLEFLFSKSERILIKTGPLLDISIGLKQLHHVKEIHSIAIANDVKELLWILEKNVVKEPLIKTVNFKNKEVQRFEFRISDEVKATPSFSTPQRYLYEPNAAILKTGPFQYLGTYYGLTKLHVHSHLYFSSSLIPFPGRVFKVEEVLDYSVKSFKKRNISKANITTRNFPDTVASVRKKLGLKEGGEHYLFCTTDHNEKLMLLVCTQLFRN